MLLTLCFTNGMVLFILQASHHVVMAIQFNACNVGPEDVSLESQFFGLMFVWFHGIYTFELFIVQMNNVLSCARKLFQRLLF